MLRTCEDSVFEHRDRPCLLYQIKRCTAPCVGHISEEDYCDSVRQAATFLNGKTDELTRTLQHKMQTAAANLQFEEAARYRDQIQALGIIQSDQFIDSKTRTTPTISTCSRSPFQTALSAYTGSASAADGTSATKASFPTPKRPRTKRSRLRRSLRRPTLSGQSKPDIIISNFPVPDALKEALEGEHGKQMQFVTKTIGERKVWLKMAEQNAQMAITQRHLQQSNQQHRIDELAKILGMNSDGINRLECFDISHTQGEATIASCVVYDEQNIQPSQYRRYNITTAKPGDDYAAMREVLTRRYGKIQEAEANGESVKW